MTPGSAPRVRLLVVAAAVAALAGCASPGEGRLDADAVRTPEDSEVQVVEAAPVDVAPTTPPQVVVIPDKPGAGNCRLLVRPLGCFDSTQQILELLGKGSGLVKDTTG